jgi:hypothetical protein
MALDNKLYFDQSMMPFVMVELLMQLLAKQDLMIEMQLHPERKWTDKEAQDFINEKRDTVLKKLYEEFGITPNVST